MTPTICFPAAASPRRRVVLAALLLSIAAGGAVLHRSSSALATVPSLSPAPAPARVATASGPSATVLPPPAIHSRPVAGENIAVAAVAGAMHNAFAQLELLDDDCVASLCGPVWRAMTHPFVPDMNDASPANLALVERHAYAGNEDALAALLVLGAGEFDYAARSHDMLVFAAARGSVLALTTLAERASVGFGFAHPSQEAAVLLEYLAWRTGNWTPTDTALVFVPSIARALPVVACEAAIAVGRDIAAMRPIFTRRLADDARCLASSETL